MQTAPLTRSVLALSVLLGSAPIGATLAAEATLSQPAIARLARLPAGGIQAVETTDGELLFLSDNGRYAFRGPAVDLWHGARLTDLDTAQRLAGRIDLRHIKLDARDLGAIDFGEGPDVLVFADPYCPHSQALLAELAAVTDRYRVRLIPLPALGEASQTAVLAINCLSVTDPAKARQALSGALDPTTLPKPTGECGQTVSQRALITAQILGVQGTPYLIAPDGRLNQGHPQDLQTWLAKEGQ